MTAHLTRYLDCRYSIRKQQSAQSQASGSSNPTASIPPPSPPVPYAQAREEEPPLSRIVIRDPVKREKVHTDLGFPPRGPLPLRIARESLLWRRRSAGTELLARVPVPQHLRRENKVQEGAADEAVQNQRVVDFGESREDARERAEEVVEDLGEVSQVSPEGEGGEGRDIQQRPTAGRCSCSSRRR